MNVRSTCTASRPAAAALAVVAALGVAGCGSAPPVFHPGGQGPSAAAQQGTDSVIMPAFGPNAHVVMTGWLPGNASLARAVITDKDYELAYLYAEYTGGRDDNWASYVSQAMGQSVRNALSATDVTTESFKGTIRIFDMRVIRDPVIKADVDVSACFDNAQAVNTSLTTGAVLPGQSPSDSNYYRYTDELAPAPAGQWQVVSSYAPVYYPQAKECKP
jgi:hypothetical protein